MTRLTENEIQSTDLFLFSLSLSLSSLQVRVPGDLATYLQRLSTDFTKSLQQTDPNTSEYVERLNNEGLYLSLACAVQEYYMRHHVAEVAANATPAGTPTEHSMNASRMAIKRIIHMYYKTDAVAAKLEQHAANVARFGKVDDHHPACKGKDTRAGVVSEDATATHPGSWMGAPTVLNFECSDVNTTMKQLCLFVFNDIAGASKEDMARAQLCQVYYHALHDRYHQARDLMLMSKLEPTSYDIQIQILYNRTVAQIGLCAFRVGLYNNSKDCLSEICGRNKQKELLAQGMSYFRGRGQDRDVEAERAERRRQVPYHHHINLEMVECFQLIGKCNILYMYFSILLNRLLLTCVYGGSIEIY